MPAIGCGATRRASPARPGRHPGRRSPRRARRSRSARCPRPPTCGGGACPAAGRSRTPQARSVSVSNTNTGTSRSVRGSRRPGRRHARLRRLRERRAATEAAVHEVAVVRVRQRRDRVEVRHEPERRLRLADAEHAARLQTAEQDAGLVAYRPAGLREDVVREAVARMGQRRVAARLRGFRRVEPGLLHGHTDPRVRPSG